MTCPNCTVQTNGLRHSVRAPSPLPFIVAYGAGGIVLYLSMLFCPDFASQCMYVGLPSMRYNAKSAALGLMLIVVGLLLTKVWYTKKRAWRAAQRRTAGVVMCKDCGQVRREG